RPAAVGPTVRYGRSAKDDLADVRLVGRGDRGDAAAFPGWSPERDHADDLLGGGVLPGLGGGQRRLPDGERDLPAGDAGPGDRPVLFGGHCYWRPGSAGPVRRLAGQRPQGLVGERLPVRRWPDAGGGGNGMAARRGGRAALAGGRDRAPV